jgi:hypothetical protein
MAKLFEERIIITDPDLDVTISTVTKKDKPNVPAFTCVGRQTMKSGNTTGYPLIKVLLSLTKGEQWLYGLIHEHMDYTTNKAYFPKNLITKVERPKLSIAYKALNEKDLVKRVSNGVYMVNPDAVIYPQSYARVKAEWDEL